MKKCSGFSLLELLITIAIMGIVMSISTISFNSWTKKSNIEKQVRELFTDLAESRSRAFHEKKEFRVTFQPNSYVIRNYSSEAEPRDAGRIVSDKALTYGLTSKSGTNLAGDISDKFVEFDTRGWGTNNFTVIVNPLTVDSALNCLVIYDTRVNMGKINGTTCVFK